MILVKNKLCARIVAKLFIFGKGVLTMIIKFKVGEYYDICEKYEDLFEQDDRGVMRVTPKGRRDLRTFSHHVGLSY